MDGSGFGLERVRVSRNVRKQSAVGTEMARWVETKVARRVEMKMAQSVERKLE